MEAIGWDFFNMAILSIVLAGCGAAFYILGHAQGRLVAMRQYSQAIEDMKRQVKETMRSLGQSIDDCEESQ